MIKNLILLVFMIMVTLNISSRKDSIFHERITEFDSAIRSNK